MDNNTRQGYWWPDAPGGEAHGGPYGIPPQMLFVDPYNVTKPEDFKHPTAPASAWETIRFAFSALARREHSLPIDFAEYPLVSRGGDIPQRQSSNVVAGNVSAAGKTDRYGPFRQQALAQFALQAYLDSSVPRGVQRVNSQTGG